MRWFRLPFLWLAASMCLGGCGLLGTRAVVPEAPRVGQIGTKLVGMKAAEVRPAMREAAPDRETVLSLYREVLPQVPDTAERFEISRRIAELELQRASDAAGAGEVVDFHVAIDAIRSVLQAAEVKVPEAGRGDQYSSTSELSIIDTPASDGSRQDLTTLRYKLAYAYDLTGDPAAVRSNLDRIIAESRNPAEVNEACFRRAELLFSAGDYPAAADDYERVAVADSPYQLHAQYMLGWSRFKQGDLDSALPPTLAVLAELQTDKPARQADLLADATRMAVLALDYLDGAATLADYMAQLDKPEWQSYLYRALGDWYREKERFSDSALTWETFIEHNPMHREAPQIYLEVIETYRSAGFVDDLPTRKLDFINRFERTSAFFEAHGEAVFATYRDTLMAYVDYFSALAHARAQTSATADDYRAAAAWYKRWLDNFVGEEESAEKLFLMAESLNAAEDWSGAIGAWQQLIDVYPDHGRVRESHYAVVVATEAWAATANLPLLEERVTANLVFASRYPDDDRAATSQLKAAQLLFDQGQYVRAAEAADLALANWTLGDLEAPALLISGHSWFELLDYAVAEARYRRLLVMDPNDGIQSRLLAAVFRQAELAEAEGNLDVAIARYAELLEIAPNDPVAIAAMYDVAGLYELAGRVPEAINQLAAFRARYPHHQLNGEIPLRLVSLFESSGRFADAARELEIVQADRERDDETRRLALYRMGELYLAAGDSGAAIATFRNYAHSYAVPVSLRMEAMHHLDLLYQQSDEPTKRAFWLRKKTEMYDSLATADITPRIRSLAAEAALTLAGDRLADFERATLTLPLKKSLKAKRKVMAAAIAAFEKAAGYEVAEVTTAATFSIGTIYQSLASTLMASARPAGLNDMELEQYELLLEEQAFPFEEQAIELHEINLQRGWRNAWDPWINRSLAELQRLSPGRYRRDEPALAALQVLY
ncbi:MAG: tetratricopeptide repeat protein [Pseudomonadota bacterium]